jgi:hypothetical protein
MGEFYDVNSPLCNTTIEDNSSCDLDTDKTLCDIC